MDSQLSVVSRNSGLCSLISGSIEATRNSHTCAWNVSFAVHVHGTSVLQCAWNVSFSTALRLQDDDVRSDQYLSTRLLRKKAIIRTYDSRQMHNDEGTAVSVNRFVFLDVPAASLPMNGLVTWYQHCQISKRYHVCLHARADVCSSEQHGIGVATSPMSSVHNF